MKKELCHFLAAIAVAFVAGSAIAIPVPSQHNRLNNFSWTGTCGKIEIPNDGSDPNNEGFFMDAPCSGELKIWVGSDTIDLSKPFNISWFDDDRIAHSLLFLFPQSDHWEVFDEQTTILNGDPSTGHLIAMDSGFGFWMGDQVGDPAYSWRFFAGNLDGINQWYGHGPTHFEYIDNGFHRVPEPSSALLLALGGGLLVGGVLKRRAD